MGNCPVLFNKFSLVQTLPAPRRPLAVEGTGAVAARHVCSTVHNTGTVVITVRRVLAKLIRLTAHCADLCTARTAGWTPRRCSSARRRWGRRGSSGPAWSARRSLGHSVLITLSHYRKSILRETIFNSFNLCFCFEHKYRCCLMIPEL